MDDQGAGDLGFDAQSPSIELPKGGGALTGITSDFSISQVTGTASLSVPLPISSARGFQPELSIAYDSGAGNSEFGLGWQLGIPAVSRRIDKRLPTYNDEENEDVYAVSGSDDLVPVLYGADVRQLTIELQGIEWEVTHYRPRVGPMATKIERWRERESNRIWWRTVSADNITTVFGYNDSACIHEPGKRAKTFRWLIDFVYDDKGHVTKFVYQSENFLSVDFAHTDEQHRLGSKPSQVYLKKVLYGIKESRLRSGYSGEDLLAVEFEDRDFHFQTVLDYGDHPGEQPGCDATQDWPARKDPFSDYRPGFEVRTVRLCQRALLFHDFPELGERPVLVSSLDFEYGNSTQSFSLLQSIQKRGFKNHPEGLEVKSLPKMEFDYQDHAWSYKLDSVAPDSLADMPGGIEGSGYQWVDLFSEGLSGLILQSNDALYYKANQGSATFAQATLLAESPSPGGAGEFWTFQGVDQPGVNYLVSTNGVTKGFYAFAGDHGWSEFAPFQAMPNLRFDDPNLRMIDLNGDGKLDLLISDEAVFRWHPSKGERGFGQASFACAPQDGSKPEIIFANNSESIFLADMTGDGLSDIVRVRNGSVVYWPNLGYGQFAAKVCMSGSPRFDYDDQFDPGRIRLTDIDGSGPADIVYLGKDRFDFWLNCSGNSWLKEGGSVNPVPSTHAMTSISTLDLLGAGTSCVVWSSGAPGDRQHAVRYIDLLGGQKPHLLKSYHNGFGKTVTLGYTPSTQFYLDDKANGQPWVTKLHFPVQCLSHMETTDAVSGTRFASSYSYHHGYYDRAEREFRGFGRVEQTDTEEYDHFARAASANVVEQVLHQTPVLTKTWFHVGAYLDRERITSQYRHEYFDHPNLAGFALPEPEPSGELTAAEWREALRACKGMALRTEVYGLDSTELESVPFSVTENTCEIGYLQGKGVQRHAVFQVLNSESIAISLDRNPADPRVEHQMVLTFDDYGRPLQSATVNYGRDPERAAESSLPDTVRKLQTNLTCIVSESAYTQDEFGPLGQHNSEDFDAPFRFPAVWRSEAFEYGIRDWDWQSGPLSRSDLQLAFAADKQANPVEYLRILDGQDVAEARSGEVRLLSAQQLRFANASLDGELAAGRMGALGVAWRSYQLAFTTALITAIFGDRVELEALQGGYIDLEQDRNWWVPSGTQVFSLASQPGAEERFFIPYGFQGSQGVCSWTDFDDYLMLSVSSSVSRANTALDPDALPRINESIAVNDYRTLSATHLRDANFNWGAVEQDALGLVVRSAVMGKVAGASGDNPPARDADCEGDNLENPSIKLSYGFYKPTTDGEPIQPSWVRTRTYTKHYSADYRPRESLIDRMDFVDQYEYSDGTGQVVMAKSQTTPGLAKQINADGVVEEIDTGDQVRWVGNGRTIVNNKGNPVKQYEPYFSLSHRYEDHPELVEGGVTPILFYDAAGRNICKLHPNRTYEKVVFDAWQQQSWDVNDTLYLTDASGEKHTDIRMDPDVGHLFSQLADPLVAPSWYQERIDGIGDSADEILRHRRAAQITESHAQTPSLVYTDSLGRTIYATAHNRVESESAPEHFEDQYLNTQTKLDVEGNMLSVTDARGNRVMSYRYCMLPPPDEENPKPAIFQDSMDGGQRWSLFDIQGKELTSWDSRDHQFETTYDDLQRPVANRVKEQAVWKTVSLRSYVDSDHPGFESNIENNLIGLVTETVDQSGCVQVLSADFKGNLTRSKQIFAKDYKQTIDWSLGTDAQLEAEAFFTSAEYDALNRISVAQAPHNENRQVSTSMPQYNESGALAKVVVSAVGGAAKVYVERIEYDAKGQRQSIQYGNGVTTQFAYEPDTYRLKSVLTRADGVDIQNLSYCYDPVGNVSEIFDQAQSTVYFDNVAVQPGNQYHYDALYRLVSATGREHAVQAGCPNFAQGFSALAQGNHNELQRYLQEYQYDSVGNIERVQHARFGGNHRANSGWTREYRNAEDSNRLLSTELSCAANPSESYAYNAHGSITSMAHLPTMDWNYGEQLRHVDLQGGGHAYYVYDAGGERTRKILETNGSLVKERLYLGGWEVYRERDSAGIRMERETLHVFDEHTRIALVESKIIENHQQGSEPSVVRYQLDNQNESACWEIGENQELISYEEFHPYGSTAYHTGTAYLEQSAKRYRYTGKERDEETGFSYHGARYLSPTLLRWTSVDSLGLAAGFNLFSYVRGNPATRQDNSGNLEADVTRKLLANVPEGLTAYTEVRAFSIDPKTGDAIQVNLDVVYVNNETGNVVNAIEAKDSATSNFRKNQGPAYSGLLEKKRALVLDPAKAPALSGKVVEPSTFSVIHHGNVDDFVSGKPITNPSTSDILRRTEPGSPKIHPKGSLKSRLYTAADYWAKGVPSSTKTTIRRRDGVRTKIEQAYDAAGNRMGKPKLSPWGRMKGGVIGAGLAVASIATAAPAAYEQQSIDPLLAEAKKTAEGDPVGEVVMVAMGERSVSDAIPALITGYASGVVVQKGAGVAKKVATSPAGMAAGIVGGAYLLTGGLSYLQGRHMYERMGGDPDAEVCRVNIVTGERKCHTPSFFGGLF